jgi:ubiquinone/menaquinone biosynthesis C-methylase UbiE
MTKEASTTPTFASFYDFYDGPEHREKQLAMYRGLAAEAGERILELASGTGIIAIDLARAGFHVTGLDVSPDMLRVAREKIAREDAHVQSRIRLVEADMKDFSLNDSFDGVFLTNNSFGYLTQLCDRHSCLQAIHHHLNPHGLMVIEERNYTPEVLAGMGQKQRAVTIQMARVNPATGKFTTFQWVTNHMDFATQTIFCRRFIEEIQDDGTVKRYVPPEGGLSRSHYFTGFELQLLIEQAGFAIRDVFGGYGGQPLAASSRSMIFVAESRPRA